MDGMGIPLRWIWMAVLVYGLLALGWHMQQPLAQFPQLDAKENLALAGLLAEGELGDEPFYRAMLYPAILSLFLLLGMPHGGLSFAALFLGLGLHWWCTGVVARIAGDLWADRRAEIAALLLYGLNPVLLHYALQPLDITLGMALFWTAAWFLLRSEASWRGWLAGGFLLGLAVLARPHFLPVLVVAPGLLWLWRARGVRAAVFLPWVGGALPLLAFGMANVGVSGEFRLLPWQGAYNLYAANRAGATGKFFAQQVFLENVQPWENPARLESETLFARATGEEPPFSIEAMNAHWRTAFRERVKTEFPDFFLLQLRKVYFLFNDFEQYNNLTYAFHKARSPVLRWNPIGWGWLLALAAGGWIAFIATRRDPRWRSWTLLAAAYASGVLLYFVSARFRLPLTGVLILFASGWATFWWRAQPDVLRRAVPLVLLALVVSYSWFFGARSKETFIQDRMLLANAAAEASLDAEALGWAFEVLEEAPQRPDALRIALVSAFNLHLIDAPEAAGLPWPLLLYWSRQLPAADPALIYIRGVALWMNGERAEAQAVWREALDRFGPDALSARKALAVAGDPEAASPVFGPSDPEWVALRRLLLADGER